MAQESTVMYQNVLLNMRYKINEQEYSDTCGIRSVGPLRETMNNSCLECIVTSQLTVNTIVWNYCMLNYDDIIQHITLI